MAKVITDIKCRSKATGKKYTAEYNESTDTFIVHSGFKGVYKTKYSNDAFHNAYDISYDYYHKN